MQEQMQKNMSIMSQMDPASRQKIMDKMHESMNANYHGDKRKMIAQHRESYRDLARHYRQNVRMENNSIAPEFISKKESNLTHPHSSLAQALPIPIQKLQLGVVHHHRVLRGRLIENPIIMTGVHCLVQDTVGDVVKVSFYPAEITPTGAGWDLGHAMFPRDTPVAILEPFFKQALDGTFLIRVDNMDDVVFGVKKIGAPSTPAEFNDEGKRQVSANQYEEAQSSYHAALACISVYELYQRLLQNLSLVHFELKQYSTALQYATAAVTVHPEAAPKAYFRAALALRQLNCQDLAIECCKMVYQQNPSAGKDPVFKSLCLEFKWTRESKSKTEKGNIWNSPQMIKCLALDPCIMHHDAGTTYDEDPNVLKQRGNECVAAKNYDQAQEWYEKALYQLEKLQNVSMAKIVSNISFCCFKIGAYEDAMISATVALMLEPAYKKAHSRRISSLLNMELMDEAKTCLDYGLLVLKDASDCLRPLQARLKSSTEKKTARVSRHTKGKEYKVDVAPFQMVDMINTIAEISGKGDEILRDTPAFHLKYSKVRGWPVQCDPLKCQELLGQAFALGRSDMHRYLLLNDPEKIVKTPDYILKRLGSNSKSDLAWLLSAEEGDVHFRERRLYGGGDVHHSYGNVAQRSQILTLGTTHVSVGFADLQELWLCQLKPSRNECASASLKWIGYDQSPYVVAKTMVLIEMMKHEAVPVASVVQVWYSSAWSHETLRHFRTALNHVCDAQAEEDPGQPIRKNALVRAYWIHWQQHDVSLIESREGWMKGHDCTWSTEICNWKREQDQLAMCTYALTGQLYYPEGELSVGSVVMYALPHGDQVAPNENVFQVVQLKDLIEHADTLGEPKSDCVMALTSLLENKIELLMERIRRQDLDVSVYCEEVGLDNPTLLDEIRHVHSPYSMSWSNICDYLAPAAFHAIARHCSVGNNTVHFGYSMNWPLEVKGTFTGDYYFALNQEYFSKFVETMLETAESNVGAVWKETCPLGLKYLTFPPHTNPLNVMDWGILMARQLYTQWFDAFIKAAAGKLESPQYYLDPAEMVLYQFNRRSHHILNFHLTYDPEIVMHAV